MANKEECPSLALLDVSGAFKPLIALSGEFRELSKVGGGQLMEKPSRPLPTNMQTLWLLSNLFLKPVNFSLPFPMGYIHLVFENVPTTLVNLVRGTFSNLGKEQSTLTPSASSNTKSSHQKNRGHSRVRDSVRFVPPSNIVIFVFLVFSILFPCHACTTLTYYPSLELQHQNTKSPKSKRKQKRKLRRRKK